MAGLEIKSPGADAFVKLLGKYLELNTRNAGELVQKKAKDVSVQLYKATAKLAPSNAEIVAKVKSLGWRVKRKPGAWKLRKGEKKGNAGPLHRMEASVIGTRQKHRGYVATGWLPGVEKLGGSVGTKLAKVQNPKGSATIEGIGTDKPRVVIANQTPGIDKLERDHGIVDAAFKAASKDIEVYIQRKQQELENNLR